METEVESVQSSSGWKRLIEDRLPLLGHRNWIVVADAAYPAQSNSGIETVASGLSQQDTIEAVLALLRPCLHVHPLVHLDRELTFVEEQDAPGIDDYRSWLKTALQEFTVDATPHEEIIARLDRAAQMFSVLIVKSTMLLPYTSVFLELDCGYWNAEAEGRLRAALQRESTR
jgi:L-fucose mutarotase/ribose pyranase (RbsD/FucU family)